MARTKLVPKKRMPPNIDFEVRRTQTTKSMEGIRGRRQHPRNVKIKVLLPNARNIEVKKGGQVVRRMTVRRKTIYPPTKINHHRTY